MIKPTGNMAFNDITPAETASWPAGHALQSSSNNSPAYSSQARFTQQSVATNQEITPNRSKRGAFALFGGIQYRKSEGTRLFCMQKRRAGEPGDHDIAQKQPLSRRLSSVTCWKSIK